MKHIIPLRMLLLTVALTGCVTTKPGDAPLTQHQKIAAACIDIAAAADTIATGVDSGKITKADGKKAATLYHTTDQFCEPPVEKLDASNYGKLVSVLVSLAAMSGAVK